MKKDVAKDKIHYCSKQCHNEAKKVYCAGENNHQYGLRGIKNDSWKGGKRKTQYGYYAIQVIGHPFAQDKTDYVLEHRIVAEKYLLTDSNSIEIDGKRYLSPKYVVHHKNGNRTDNRPENLEVMTKEEHTRLHSIENIRQRDSKGRFIKCNGSSGR